MTPSPRVQVAVKSNQSSNSNDSNCIAVTNALVHPKNFKSRREYLISRIKQRLNVKQLKRNGQGLQKFRSLSEPHIRQIDMTSMNSSKNVRHRVSERPAGIVAKISESVLGVDFSLYPTSFKVRAAAVVPNLRSSSSMLLSNSLLKDSTTNPSYDENQHLDINQLKAKFSCNSLRRSALGVTVKDVQKDSPTKMELPSILSYELMEPSSNYEMGKFQSTICLKDRERNRIGSYITLSEDAPNRAKVLNDCYPLKVATIISKVEDSTANKSETSLRMNSTSASGIERNIGYMSQTACDRSDTEPENCQDVKHAAPVSCVGELYFSSPVALSTASRSINKMQYPTSVIPKLSIELEQTSPVVAGRLQSDNRGVSPRKMVSRDRNTDKSVLTSPVADSQDEEDVEISATQNKLQFGIVAIVENEIRQLGSVVHELKMFDLMNENESSKVEPLIGHGIQLIRNIKSIVSETNARLSSCSALRDGEDLQDNILRALTSAHMSRSINSVRSLLDEANAIFLGKLLQDSDYKVLTPMRSLLNIHDGAAVPVGNLATRWSHENRKIERSSMVTDKTTLRKQNTRNCFTDGIPRGNLLSLVVYWYQH